MTLSSEERYPDPEEVHRRLFAAAIVGIWTASPGAIVAFDAGKVTATVQIGVQGQQLKPDGSVVPFDMPELQDVPVVFPRGGGATLTFPIKAGDECLIVFGCRSIDAWWQNGGIQAPSDSRTHDLSDAFVLVGPMSQANKITGISTDKVQLRSDDGETLIELDPAGQNVRVLAPGEVTVDSPTSHFTGDVHIDGDLQVDGDINCNGSITAADDITSTGGDVIASGISLQTHVHSAVQSGSDTSGPPVP